jgi:hypothetical protein
MQQTSAQVVQRATPNSTSQRNSASHNNVRIFQGSREVAFRVSQFMFVQFSMPVSVRRECPSGHRTSSRTNSCNTMSCAHLASNVAHNMLVLVSSPDASLLSNHLSVSSLPYAQGANSPPILPLLSSAFHIVSQPARLFPLPLPLPRPFPFPCPLSSPLAGRCVSRSC